MLSSSLKARKADGAQVGGYKAFPASPLLFTCYVQKIAVIVFRLVDGIRVSSSSEMDEVRCMHGNSMEGGAGSCREIRARKSWSFKT